MWHWYGCVCARARARVWGHTSGRIGGSCTAHAGRRVGAAVAPRRACLLPAACCMLHCTAAPPPVPAAVPLPQVKGMLEEYRIGRLKGGAAAPVADPYANEPARLPALIVRSQKPMNSGGAGVAGRGAGAWAEVVAGVGPWDGMALVRECSGLVVPPPCHHAAHPRAMHAPPRAYHAHARSHAPTKQPAPGCRDAQGAAGGQPHHPQRALLRAQPPARAARGRRHLPAAGGGGGGAHGERDRQAHGGGAGKRWKPRLRLVDAGERSAVRARPPCLSAPQHNSISPRTPHTCVCLCACRAWRRWN